MVEFHFFYLLAGIIKSCSLMKLTRSNPFCPYSIEEIIGWEGANGTLF